MSPDNPKTSDSSLKPEWTISFTNSAGKQIRQLARSGNKQALSNLDLLVHELAFEGPEQKEWKNYSLLTNKDGVHHCHFKSGKPTLVAIWKVTDYQEKRMEVQYVGTHEGIDYNRF
jgi:mRNA-degrading endonuclease YafQ of YafQ-DinJ toxin-antitoxin module